MWHSAARLLLQPKLAAISRGVGAGAPLASLSRTNSNTRRWISVNSFILAIWLVSFPLFVNRVIITSKVLNEHSSRKDLRLNPLAELHHRPSAERHRRVDRVVKHRSTKRGERFFHSFFPKLTEKAPSTYPFT